mmetsp:Transcript_32019/g.73148  ORF Transcript_32019/g.73148 Transcript_32019/m.73148 type:complete len:280 (+) Transcript_32019:24-863(+)
MNATRFYPWLCSPPRIVGVPCPRQNSQNLFLFFSAGSVAIVSAFDTSLIVLLRCRLVPKLSTGSLLVAVRFNTGSWISRPQMWALIQSPPRLILDDVLRSLVKYSDLQSANAGSPVTDLCSPSFPTAGAPSRSQTLLAPLPPGTTICAMPFELPRQHRLPAWWYTNLESLPSLIARPTCLPCWAATCAVGGKPDRAQSPIAYTPSVPRTRRSSSTFNPLMSDCPSFCASFFTSGRAPMPAAQTRQPISSVWELASASFFCSGVAPRGKLGWHVTSRAST